MASEWLLRPHWDTRRNEINVFYHGICDKIICSHNIESQIIPFRFSRLRFFFRCLDTCQAIRTLLFFIVNLLNFYDNTNLSRVHKEPRCRCIFCHARVFAQNRDNRGENERRSSLPRFIPFLHARFIPMRICALRNQFKEDCGGSCIDNLDPSLCSLLSPSRWPFTEKGKERDEKSGKYR